MSRHDVSSHAGIMDLAALADEREKVMANLVSIDKHFVRKKIPQTTVRITPEGRAAVQNYWKNLDRIRSSIESLKD